MNSKWRQVFLRAIDYAWYGISILAAIVAINNLQRQTLSRDLERMFARNEANHPRLEEHVQKLSSACAEVQGPVDVPAAALDQGTLSGAKRICAVYAAVGRPNRSAFIESCRIWPYPSYDTEGGALEAEQPLPPKLSDALAHVAFLCE